MDTESESFASKAFEIFEDIGGYDPKDQPTNGYEYLYQVILETSKTPQTKVAPINTEIYRKNQTFYVQETKKHTVDEGFIPSDEWQSKQLNHFKFVRNIIAEMKKNWKKGTLKFEIVNQTPDNFGLENEWLKFCAENQPLLSTLFSINQPGLDQLLNYFSLWLQDNSMKFSNITTMWLYSIFACLEEPLPPNTCANLRSVIRLIKDERSSLKSATDEILLPLNVIICIAVRYFNQTDLGD